MSMSMCEEMMNIVKANPKVYAKVKEYYPSFFNRGYDDESSLKELQFLKVAENLFYKVGGNPFYASDIDIAGSTIIALVRRGLAKKTGNTRERWYSIDDTTAKKSVSNEYVLLAEGIMTFRKKYIEDMENKVYFEALNVFAKIQNCINIREFIEKIR